MESNRFKELLTDLYNIYNPDKLSDIERIVSQYNGREFDAIKTVYIKYNFRQSPSYDSNLGTDKHVKSLIENYSQGNRILALDFINNQKQNQEKKRIEEQNKLVQEKIKIELQKQIEEEEKKNKIKEIQEKINEQEKVVNQKLKESNEELKKELDKIKEELDKGVGEFTNHQIIEIVERKCPFDIQLKFNFESSDNIIVPDLNNFLYVSINQRVILKQKDGGIIGLEIVDILDDYMTNPDQPVREIILEKK